METERENVYELERSGVYDEVDVAIVRHLQSYVSHAIGYTVIGVTRNTVDRFKHPEKFITDPMGLRSGLKSIEGMIRGIGDKISKLKEDPSSIENTTESVLFVEECVIACFCMRQGIKSFTTKEELPTQTQQHVENVSKKTLYIGLTPKPPRPRSHPINSNFNAAVQAVLSTPQLGSVIDLEPHG